MQRPLGHEAIVRAREERRRRRRGLLRPAHVVDLVDVAPLRELRMQRRLAQAVQQNGALSRAYGHEVQMSELTGRTRRLLELFLFDGGVRGCALGRPRQTRAARLEMRARRVLLLHARRQTLVELDYAIGRTQGHAVATRAHRAQHVYRLSLTHSFSLFRSVVLAFLGFGSLNTNEKKWRFFI